VNAFSPVSEDIDSGVICLALLTRYLRRPADPDVIRHDLGFVAGRANREDIVRAAKRLKLKARIVKQSPNRLDRLSLPVIIEKTDGCFAILAALSADKALLQDPQFGPPRELSRADFETGWSGYAILITARAFS
jgi:subfamily B ATP-binding cassette protein HlyB/CyaB